LRERARSEVGVHDGVEQVVVDGIIDVAVLVVVAPSNDGEDTKGKKGQDWILTSECDEKESKKNHFG